MTTELQRLTTRGRELVTDDFLRPNEEPEELPTDDIDRYLDPVDATGDLEAIRERMDEVRSSFDKYDEDIDGAVAPTVHANLELTRRQASDPGVWHYLAAVEFPEFVRHRWKHTGNIREKFLGGWKDIYSNAVGRLWWIAELTYDESAAASGADRETVYERTDAAFEKQTLANKVFDREYAQYKPAAVACVEVLAGEDSEVVEAATLRLNDALSNVHLESRDESEIKEMVRQIRRDVSG